MKRTHKLVSLLLVVLLMVTCVIAAFNVSAAGDKVYVKVNSNYGTPNCYMWNGQGGIGNQNAGWPGIAMTAEGDGVYSYIPDTVYANVIFNGGGGQTADLTYPGPNNIYILDSNKWETYDPSAAEPSIALSKKDGASFKTETLTVTVTTNNADSAYYTVDNGSQVSFTGSVDVTLGANTAVGSTVTLYVSATNANGTVTSSATYTKKAPSTPGGAVDDGSTASALDGYYSTNPNEQVGKRANITIDGSISDWDSSMLIAQGVANDDPRVYKPSSMHEIPIDDYALYAAWDNNNLYLMWEMANVQDAIAPSDNFPLSQGNLWIYNLPIFLYFSIDPSIEGDGTVSTGGTIWDSGITFDANVDTVVAMSTNASNGPFVYKADDSGKIEYNNTTQSGIKIEWGNSHISENMWGIDEGYGHYNNRTPGDTLEDTSKWIDYNQDKDHSKKLDMFYEVSIPLDLLGTSASEIEANGIGLMKVSTFGTSGMNSLPADPSMWDNADKDYSKDPTSSMEKEDEDHITVPLARIGKLFAGGGTVNPPVTPPTTQPTDPVVKPTEPVVKPTEPAVSVTYYLGDADMNGIVNVKDATTVQKDVAGAEDITDTVALLAADADQNSEINVKDATTIQKYVAGAKITSPVGELLKVQ